MWWLVVEKILQSLCCVLEIWQQHWVDLDLFSGKSITDHVAKDHKPDEARRWRAKRRN